MTDPPRIATVILRVSDMDRSTRFYRDVFGIPLKPGFNSPEEDPWYGGQHAEFSWREGAYLHFALFPSRPPEKPQTSAAEIGLFVTDTNELHKRAVAAGVRVLHDPRSEPWGLTARYLDPDGNVVSVTSP
jgi:lactoylglutathione lyase